MHHHHNSAQRERVDGGEVGICSIDFLKFTLQTRIFTPKIFLLQEK
jgi:hypothetical protein